MLPNLTQNQLCRFIHNTLLKFEAGGIKARTNTVKDIAAKGFNQYCDAAGTVYTGGSPLFDEKTGKSIPLSKYLASKFLILK